MYRAPEVWLAASKDHLGYGVSVDLWAFGLLLYTVFSGLLPFDEETHVADIQSARIDYNDHAWKGRAADAIPLIRHICVLLPQARIPLSQALATLFSLQT